ncbi:uncharacterized protein LOC125026018 [Penaeus chinensis]|uniref:uncharacterized protein LOC125026018 n=1 Tax=Penaeus chinensis TaxID=139456 RepID=UPI001FB5DF15|nr:uncharacterized protein LOC125026018 [Penaeus chinensis]
MEVKMETVVMSLQKHRRQQEPRHATHRGKTDNRGGESSPWLASNIGASRVGSPLYRFRSATSGLGTLEMRQYRAQALLTVVLAAAAWSATGMPLPALEAEENALNEVSEGGLLVLVPTLPLDEHERSGQDLKREVEYDLISIPEDVLRREIRQVVQQYGTPR